MADEDAPEPNLPPLECPRCAGWQLVQAEMAGLTIRRCTNCLGLFLSHRDFEFLIQRQAQLSAPAAGAAAPQRADPDLTIRYINCPVCFRQMARANWQRASGVILDTCPEHGVWLDDAELQQLLAFIASGGLQAAAEATKRDDERLARHRQEMLRARNPLTSPPPVRPRSAKFWDWDAGKIDAERIVFPDESAG